MELARDLALEMQAEGKGLVLNQVQEASIPAKLPSFWRIDHTSDWKSFAIPPYKYTFPVNSLRAAVPCCKRCNLDITYAHKLDRQTDRQTITNKH